MQFLWVGLEVDLMIRRLKSAKTLAALVATVTVFAVAAGPANATERIFYKPPRHPVIQPVKGFQPPRVPVPPSQSTSPTVCIQIYPNPCKPDVGPAPTTSLVRPVPVNPSPRPPVTTRPPITVPKVQPPTTKYPGPIYCIQQSGHSCKPCPDMSQGVGPRTNVVCPTSLSGQSGEVVVGQSTTATRSPNSARVEIGTACVMHRDGTSEGC